MDSNWGLLMRGWIVSLMPLSSAEGTLKLSSNYTYSVASDNGKPTGKYHSEYTKCIYV